MIYKPIYIVGYPHGGCTLLCNMLRESSKIFTIVGTKNIREITRQFGSGIEGHNSLFDLIPNTLRNPEGKGKQCWRYGWNEYIDQHHLIEKDVKSYDVEQYLDVIDDVKKYFNVTDDMRFLDKSQSYLVKTRYVQALLSPADVFFIFVIRNPYILCYKPAKWAMYTKHERGIEQVINTYNCFMKDSEFLKHFKIVKFEDVILDTRNILKEICSFLDLNFEEDMMPHDRPDIDQQMINKFYPVKKDVIYDDGRNSFKNKKLDNLIANRCNEIIKRFDYTIP